MRLNQDHVGWRALLLPADRPNSATGHGPHYHSRTLLKFNLNLEIQTEVSNMLYCLKVPLCQKPA